MWGAGAGRGVFCKAGAVEWAEQVWGSKYIENFELELQ